MYENGSSGQEELSLQDDDARLGKREPVKNILMTDA